jgi:hypothetical protein
MVKKWTSAFSCVPIITVITVIAEVTADTTKDMADTIKDTETTTTVNILSTFNLSREMDEF